MVIEELRFAVDPADHAQFLDVEGRVWTGFLQTVPGVVRKEVWVSAEDPGSIVVMIWWESTAAWKAVTPAQCDAVDARMGEWLRPITHARAYDVVRTDSIQTENVR